MKIGIVTLVSENYGNKFQNYAVETLLKRYGDITTFSIAERPTVSLLPEAKNKLRKLNLKYIVDVLRHRMLYQYDITHQRRSAIATMLWAKRNHDHLFELKAIRSKSFETFTHDYLHIADESITANNCADSKLQQYDYFVCGSDQIWNPNYKTTNELAFLSFVNKDKAIALAPSFGVSELPENMKKLYAGGLRHFKKLSVREEAGAEIIKELTNLDAEVLLDPTMALEVADWQKLMKAPRKPLPKHYIVCYFLGMVSKKNEKQIQRIAENRQLPLVMLFDIESPDYYTYGPDEVLYTIYNADLVLTDSFHGTVFSILFHKNFIVFDRDEGGTSMNSRLETLLNAFSFSTGNSEMVPEDRWKYIDEILVDERKRTAKYLEDAIT